MLHVEPEKIETEKELKKMTNQNTKCVICKEDYTGHGNNAEPVMSGYCCDNCNATIVIPARVQDADMEGLTDHGVAPQT